MKKEGLEFPKRVSYILEQLERKGEGYLVGGCVRDILLGKEPHDYDFCTNLSYEELKRIFKPYPCKETGKVSEYFEFRLRERNLKLQDFALMREVTEDDLKNKICENNRRGLGKERFYNQCHGISSEQGFS